MWASGPFYVVSLLFLCFCEETEQSQNLTETQWTTRGCPFWVEAAATRWLRGPTSPTYLHICKPSCDIASQTRADVCCSHQFSASLSFMCNLFVWLTSSYSSHLSRAAPRPRATEWPFMLPFLFIYVYSLYFLCCCGDLLPLSGKAAELSLQAWRPSQLLEV